jgi:branched-chain amino acid transport system permease protein
VGAGGLQHQPLVPDLLFMVIIGGLGSIMGSFFGAAFIVMLPIFLDQRCPLANAGHADRHRRSPRTSTFMIFGGADRASS